MRQAVESVSAVSIYTYGESEDHRSKDHPSLADLPDTGDKGTWALFYARHMKIPVFPLYETYGERCSCGRRDCNNQGKHPRTRNGLKDATFDPEQIWEWWKEWPNANIGGRMGKVCDATVLDADTPEAVAFLEEHLPHTTSQTTGSGGRQFFVLYEEGFKNWKNLPPGFDIRTDNGYVVLPPSHNKNGLYSWDKVTDKKGLPEEVRKTILFHRKKEQESVRSTSKKIHKVITEGISPSWDAVKEALDDVKDRFSPEEMIPEGSRHNRLLEIGGSLRGKGVPEGRIVLCLRWMNTNLCNPPLSSREFEDILNSVMKLKREINDLVDDFEEWLETQEFKGKGGATDKKVSKTLLCEAKKYGEKGIEGLDVAISQLDLKDRVGVGYKTVNASLKRIPFIVSTKNPDVTRCSTITILYPNGSEVNDDGELVVKPFIREGGNSYFKEDNLYFREFEWVEYKEYLGYPLDVHSRWGAGKLGFTKEDFLNSIIKNIGTGKPFRASDLHFINKDDNFKRRHLSELANKDKFPWRFIKKVGHGVYMVPEDVKETYERYKRESGEIEVEQNQLALTIRRRLGYKYYRALKKAFAEGRNLEEVPVPEGMLESKAIRIMESVGENQQEANSHPHNEDEIHDEDSSELNDEDLETLMYELSDF